MATAPDQDRYFSGQHKSSTPKHLLAEGEVARLLNARFIEGAITNALGFDEIEFDYAGGNDCRFFASKVTYGQILRQGDVQVALPLCNVSGKFIVAVISGILFLLDTETCLAHDITPVDACLPETTCENHLTYLDNDGGTYGAGGYATIFNYPNRPIFINETGARVARQESPFFEMPTARLGASAGSRSFVAVGDNQMWASDNLGGSSGLAPLTFRQTLEEGQDFDGQIFTIGSFLDIERITAMCRIPKFGGASQDFLAQSLLVSTRNKKYIISAGSPRDSWESIQFITYAGSGEGIAGPQACTTVGDNVVYISTGGRIKQLFQDQELNTSMSETFMDDPLGQYLCRCENTFYHRDWYRDLDHSRSSIKFHSDRLWATVYPSEAKAITKYGQESQSITHRALAVGSLDSKTQVGARASIAWEGFYDWFNPVTTLVLDEDFFVVSKDACSGRVRFHKLNSSKLDDHKTTIYTRGYFSQVAAKTKTLTEGSLYFRSKPGNLDISVSYLSNGEWICAGSCTADEKVFKFRALKNKCSTDSSSVPLKIDIVHNGCRFELENISVDARSGKERK